MSKTTGNVLDPIALLDGASPEQLGDYVRAQFPEGIPAMGADALRFTLLTSSTPGNDVNLSLPRVEGNRNFTNKIWNATRYVIGQLGTEPALPAAQSAVATPPHAALAERWILSRLSETVRTVTRLMDTFQFGEAGRQVYEFFWNEYCDWYLEISKIALYGDDAAAKERTRATLVKVLDDSLRLLQPFIPFVTEETWGYLKQATAARGGSAGTWPEALMIAPWPEPGAADPEAEADLGLIMEIVRAVRNVRAEYEVAPGHRIPATIVAAEKEALLRSQAEVLCALARLDPGQLTILATGDAPAGSLTLVAGNVTTYLPLAQLVDLEAERVRLQKELAATRQQVERGEKLLTGPFAQRAPAEVVQRERDKLAELQDRASRLSARLNELAAG
jgi:valyl-tRNA synthetase